MDHDKQEESVATDPSPPVNPYTERIATTGGEENCQRLQLSHAFGLRLKEADWFVCRVMPDKSSRNVAFSGRMPHSDNPGGLKGSMQHWPAVYRLEFEIPRFVAAEY
jgi:hypothetical protein